MRHETFGLGTAPYLVLVFVSIVASRRITALWQPDELAAVPFFPAAGVAVGLALHIVQWRRLFRASIAVVFVASILDTTIWTSADLRSVVADAVANTLQVAMAVTGVAWADRRTATPGVSRSFGHLGAVVGATVTGAAIATTGFTWVQDHASFFVHWMVGDLLSIAIVAPLFFLREPPWPAGRSTRAVWAELILTGTGIVALSVWLLRRDSIYLSLPVGALVWVAVRFGPRGAFPVAAIVAAIASRFAVLDLGPLSADSFGLLDIHILMASVVVGVHLAVSQVENERIVRERLDTALKARDDAEVRVRQLGDSAFAGVVQLDSDLRITYANEWFAGVVGRSAADLIGCSLRELFDDEQWMQGQRLVATLLSGGSVQADVRFRHSAGHEVILLGTMRGQIDAATGDKIMTSVFIDVTRQRQAEQVQRELLDRVARAEDDERRRLGRALHDGPIQELVAVDLRLGLMRRTAARSEPTVAGQIQALEHVVEDVIGQLRGTLADLVPADVTSGRLGPMLHDLAVRLDHARHRTVHLTDSDVAITGRTAEVLYAIGREAITNTNHHSGASNLWIVLGHEADMAVMEIDDDGIGFLTDPRVDPMHLGLLTMRERAVEAGGTCVVLSRAGGGTRVVVRLPIDGPRDGALDRARDDARDGVDRSAQVASSSVTG